MCEKVKEKPVEHIQLLDQELNAGGDEQVGEVVAVDLKYKQNCQFFILNPRKYGVTCTKEGMMSR